MDRDLFFWREGGNLNDATYREVGRKCTKVEYDNSVIVLLDFYSTGSQGCAPYKEMFVFCYTVYVESFSASVQ